MALRTKLGLLSSSTVALAHAHLLRNTAAAARLFSDNPPEPIPDRPLRNQSRFSPDSNRGNPNPFRAETDADFLERFKLGLDSDTKSSRENPNKADKADTSSVEPQDADEIFRKMKETGLIPNAVAMLDGLCKDGLVQDAMKLFGLMREKGAIPEVVVYTAVVEGFCKAHKFDDAVRIFKKMESNGILPNAFTYQVLIRGLCGGKRLEEAYEFTIGMLEAGSSPNLATFTGLIDGYCREKGVEEAQSVIGAMRLKGFFVEEKAAKEYLDKKGPFSPLVWETILGKKAPRKSPF